jgi:hypothetical protein
MSILENVACAEKNIHGQLATKSPEMDLKKLSENTTILNFGHGVQRATVMPYLICADIKRKPDLWKSYRRIAKYAIIMERLELRDFV